MSETIGELILPGTYIEVRSEGLIGVPGIATGVVGVVGTANRGPLNQVTLLGSAADALDTFGSYAPWPAKADDQLTLPRTLEQLFAGGASSVYAVRAAKLTGDMAAMSWTVFSDATPPAALFTLTASSPGTWANGTDAVKLAPAGGGSPAVLTVRLGGLKQTFIGANAGELVDALNADTRLVAVSGFDQANRGARAQTVAPAKKPDGTPVTGGPDGTPITAVEMAAGLDLLANRPVNIVVLGGMSAKDGAAIVLAHLERTENDGRERIAVLGASSDATDKILSDDLAKGSSPRLVLVAPGIVGDDGAGNPVRLPAAYTAALVAGRLAALAPHVSLTNQVAPAADLTTEYSRAQQKLLLTNQVLVLAKGLGIRVLRGITTDTGAFRQITVRRIVDYAKAGVRLGAAPYIGRLNNLRVRAALKATLDGFLSGMVLDEMLVAYTLDVSANREQEINGQAIVTMTLQPTFSIDFVKVIMNLQ